MWNSKVFVVLHACYAIFSSGLKTEAEDIYHWKTLEFENLPLPEDSFIGKYPYYIPENVDVLGLTHHVSSGLIIITAGRLRPGVPSALNAFCTDDFEKGSSPRIWGFPDYERNTLKASFYEDSEGSSRALHSNSASVKFYSSGYFNYFFGDKSEDSSRKLLNKRPYYSHEDFTIMAVYSPVIDNNCNRLYVVDTGTLQYTGIAMYRVQSPALIVFDLPSDGCIRRQFPVLRRLEIPSHLWKNPMGFIHLTIDQEPKGSCDDIFIYIPNIFDNTLVVCDYKKGQFWSFTDQSMLPVYAESYMVFRDYFHYSLPDGIMNVALGYPDKDGNRNAYYAPGASFGQYVVSTKLLKDSKHSYKYNPEDYHMLGYRGCNTQIIYQLLDLSTGVMFFGEMQSRRVSCWNVNTPIRADTIGVVFESEDLHFVSDLTLDSDGNLWIMTDQLPIIFLTENPLNLTEVNSKIFRVKASEAIRGTVCDISYQAYKK
ncbi:Six-bladed beta-propeller, TolB-like [Sergentomyia squamirostris]